MSSEPRIDYETDTEGETIAFIIGGNGERQIRTERYDSKSNADRGLADLARSVLALVAAGEDDLTSE